jgi:hypothetical protein
MSRRPENQIPTGAKVKSDSEEPLGPDPLRISTSWNVATLTGCPPFREHLNCGLGQSQERHNAPGGVGGERKRTPACNGSDRASAR